MSRVAAFVLAHTDHGTMIVNRFDRAVYPGGGVFGIGLDLLEYGSCALDEIMTLAAILDLRRKYFGDNVLAIDVGANIGTYTVPWAAHMTGWGRVLAFEPQERVFYALCGNIALNNLFNARAAYAVVGAIDGSMMIPVLDHTNFASAGSLELMPREQPEPIGQTPTQMERATVVTLDFIAPRPVDLIKIDVEGMELEVLTGAANIVRHHHPILWVEHTKCGIAPLTEWFAANDYRVFPSVMNHLAVHKDDPVLAHISMKEP